MVKTKTTAVERKEKLTREDLIAHLKAVGQSIIDDAEKIAPDCYYTAFITISACINPVVETTYVRYEIKRHADPRLPNRKDDE